MYRSTAVRRRKVTWFDKPQNTEPIKLTDIRRTASQVKCSCSADTESQVTFRRLSAVDRRHCRPQAVGVFGQYAACRFDTLRWFGLLCRIAFLLFLFCMRLFYLRLCAVFCFFFVCVWTYGFVSLYVSEFLTAACGVSPLRGRPALSKAQGLDPNAFYFGCGSMVLFT